MTAPGKPLESPMQPLRLSIVFLILAALLLADEAPGQKTDAGPDAGKTETKARVKAAPSARASRTAVLPKDFNLSTVRIENGEYVVPQKGGGSVFLTLDPDLQRFSQGLLDQYQVPRAAFIALNPRTGRLLAFAERGPGHVALDPSPPAASLFKVVTGAALVEHAGVTGQEMVCYSGGSSRLSLSNLEDNPVRDRACSNLAEAMGKSINPVFAKLADRKLNRSVLDRYARAFGFNTCIPFDLPLAESTVEIPSDRLERARASAGFWHSNLSPIHAAVIAATIAKQGSAMRPYLVDRIQGPGSGKPRETSPALLWRAIKPQTADALRDMMLLTVSEGTARRAFMSRAGRPLFLSRIRVAGKTGTLNGTNPFRAYTWFIGFAPVDDPQIAIAALAVNDAKWTLKATTMASEILRHYFTKR